MLRTRSRDSSSTNGRRAVEMNLNLILSTIGLGKIHSLDVEEMKDRSQINCFAHKKMFCLMWPESSHLEGGRGLCASGPFQVASLVC